MRLTPRAPRPFQALSLTLLPLLTRLIAVLLSTTLQGLRRGDLLAPEAATAAPAAPVAASSGISAAA